MVAISLGLSIGRNLFWGLGWARVVDLGFGSGLGFGFRFALAEPWLRF